MAKAKEAEAQGLALSGDEDDLQVDLSQVEEAKFELLPRGWYNCVVLEAEYGLSQNSGKPMWTLQLEVEDGPFQGRKLFTHLSFSEKALPMTKRTISRIAPQFLEGPFNPQQVADSGELSGIRCRAQVVIRPYEGEKRNSVRGLKEPAEGSGGFLDE